VRFSISCLRIADGATEVSSSMIVQDSSRVLILAFTVVDSNRLKNSSVSIEVSPVIATRICFETSPAMKISVPEAAVKS